MEREYRGGGVEKQRRRTNSGWSLLLLLLTSCLVLMKWLVILGEEGKHMTIGCHLPLLVCTCVGSGYCIPRAGGRRQDAHGIGVRWSVAGLCFHKANSSPCRAGHCRGVGRGRERWSQEDLRWCMRQAARGPLPNPGQAADHNVPRVVCQDSVTFWHLCYSRERETQV